MQIELEQRNDETRVSLSPEIKEVRIVKHSFSLLVVSEKGFGKRTLVDEYRTHKRGGKGMATMNCTNKTGKVVGALLVTEGQDIMIITHQGQMIRTPIRNIITSGRKTQGVKVINLGAGDHVTGIASVPMDEEI